MTSIGMKIFTTFSILVSFLLPLAGNVMAQPEYSVGFRGIESETKNGFSGGVWYPSSDKEFEKQWGPFNPTWAWDGMPAVGKHPVILFSHGVRGHYRNHRDTAATLAKRGYVVIAPQHRMDKWVGTRKTVAAVEYRIAEFSRTLNAFTKAEPDIAKIIDEKNIGAIGYSLGGLTVLGSSGESPSFQYADEHCKQNQKADPAFCLDVSRWMRIRLWFAGTNLVHWLYRTKLINKAVIDQVEPPIRFKAIALVAPVAAAYYPKQIQNIKAKMAVFRLKADRITRFPFHADYIHRSLKEKEHIYKTYDDAHHFAFISPFHEHFHVGTTKRFDRKGFLQKINTEILGFFQKEIPL